MSLDRTVVKWVSWSAVASVMGAWLLVATLPSAVRSEPPRAVEAPADRGAPSASGHWVNEAYWTEARSFEPNQGQVDPRVKFRSRLRGVTLFLTSTEAVLVLAQNAPAPVPVSAGELPRMRLARPTGKVVRMELVGANPDAPAIGEDRLPGAVNYLRSKDRSKWQTDIPRYAKVRLAGVYPGIDLVYYYGRDGELEYDFVVAPGADPRRIDLAFHGAPVTVDEHGDLTARIGDAEVRFRRPVVFQEIDGARRPVDGRYTVAAPEPGQTATRVGFVLGAYDTARAVVIDPVLVYSTYLSGTNGPSGFFSAGTGVTVDSAGNAFVTGGTDSFNFPTQGPLQGDINGLVDAVITKFTSSGGLVYSTYLGGPDDGVSFFGTQGTAIAVDGNGSAYVGGISGDNFPTTCGDQFCAFQSGFAGGNSDGFIAKLTPQGSSLAYATYLGGNGFERVEAIAVDNQGRAFIVGTTGSTNFPVTSGSQNPNGGSVFVTKLTPNGDDTAYSFLLGGSGPERNPRIAADAAGFAYVTGVTRSTNFPLVNPIQNALNRGTGTAFDDVFVAKFTPTGSLVYSTYLGGSGSETSGDIATDGLGNAYVTGGTTSNDFPLKNPIQVRRLNDPSRSNGFLAKFDTVGALVYSTHFGTMGTCPASGCMDLTSGVAVDSSGNPHLTGLTRSTQFPLTAGPIQGTKGGGANPNSDAFVGKLDATGTVLLYSTYLGGADNEFTGFSSPAGSLVYFPRIAVDKTSGTYVTGATFSDDFPTKNANQSIQSGSFSTFVSKLSIPTNDPVALGFVNYPDDLPSLPKDATVGVPYVGNVGVGGGRPPHRVAIVRGALPPGLSLVPGPPALQLQSDPTADASCIPPGGVGSPVVSGTPTQSGTACFDACAADPGNTQGVVKRFQITTQAPGAAAAPATRRLTVSLGGTGSGTVGILIPGAVALEPCPGCVRDYPPCQDVELHATAASGSSFAGWSTSGCGGATPCPLTMAEDTAVTALFNVNVGEVPPVLVASVLPVSRSVQVGVQATANGTVLAVGTGTATGCRIELGSSLPGVALSYQTTTPTGQLTGSPNTPVNIPATPTGGRQDFVFALTASAPVAPQNVELRFVCTNAGPAAVTQGVNTLLFSASNTAVPDIIALVATLRPDLVVDIPGLDGTGVFSVATSNVGAAGVITVTADTNGVSLPLGTIVCQTNQATGACIGPAQPSISVPIAAGAQSSFGVFVKGLGNVPFDPGRHRVFVKFSDASGVVRGATSAAVMTQLTATAGRSTDAASREGSKTAR